MEKRDINTEELLDAFIESEFKGKDHLVVQLISGKPLMRLSQNFPFPR